ncbi:hypothetical protein HYFRA_00011043, partial [Hymenoscyphus fraxineus]
VDNAVETTLYLKGPRLHLITATYVCPTSNIRNLFLNPFSFCTTLFLTNFEIPIVTTSLIAITTDLKSFDQSSWILSSYMLGYVSMVILWSKLSDILGRKVIALIVLTIFTAFSGACGASQTMNQLIIFRALQGLGGGGNFALGSIIFVELVPKELYPKYTSGISVVFSLSLLLGPIVGGALKKRTPGDGVPIGCMCIAAIALCLPADFPNQGRFRALWKKGTFWKVDFIGAGVLLVATTFLVAALEEAGQDYAWDSAFVIALLTISGVMWLAFVYWERMHTLRSKKKSEPVFPWRLMTSRVWIVTIFQLPQRFQVVNHATALSAGLRLIPFTVACPFGSAISATIAGKLKVPPLYMVICASCLQIFGFALLSSLPLSIEESRAQYGYQVIAGLGVGINISTLIIMVPYSIKEKRDLSIALGSLSQFRIMGGVIGLAIVTAAYKGYVNSHLEEFLTPEERTQLLISVENIFLFDTKIQHQIRSVFAGGYNLQFRILIAFSAAQIPSSFLMWQRKQVLI